MLAGLTLCLFAHGAQQCRQELPEGLQRIQIAAFVGQANRLFRHAVAQRQFYKALFDNFKVVDHFTVDGNLYAKQKANVGWGGNILREYQYRPKFSTMIRLNDVCGNLENVHHEVKINQLYNSIRENLK